MAVAFDAVGGPIGNTTGTQTWTHTPSGTPSAVYVTVANALGGTIAATYGGTTMTLIDSQSDGVVTITYLYGLTNLVGLGLTGAQTVTVTGGTWCTAGSVTVTGSDTASLFSNKSKATGSSTAVSGTVTSATGELVIDSTGTQGNSSALTVTASQTNQYSSKGGNSQTIWTTASTQAGAASINFTYSIATSTPWSIVMASVPAAAGAATDVIPLTKQIALTSQTRYGIVP